MTDTDGLERRIADEKTALDDAREYFRMQAAQRMQLVNFFILSTAFLVTAYGQALRDGLQTTLAVGVALLGFVIALCFLLLEWRTEQLVRKGRGPLAELQRRLAARIELPSIDQVADADDNAFLKYRRIIPALYALVAFACLVGAALPLLDQFC